MKLRLLIAFCIAILGSKSNAQNVVPNSGFETQDSCPAPGDIQLAQPWFSASYGSPDLYNSTCPMQNLFGRTGIGSAGFYVYNTFTDNREYIEAPLTTTMIAGHTYCVSFWVKRFDYKYAVDRIGAYFSQGPIVLLTTGTMFVTPQVESPAGTALAASGWMEISGTFTASGGEDYIVIGNFRTDANTSLTIVNAGSTGNVAYYAVDDISVVACSIGVEEYDQGLESIRIGPVPVIGKLQVELPAISSPIQCHILDVSGRLVKDLSIPASPGGKQLIDVSSLVAGSYFLVCNNGSHILTRKFVIG